MTKSKHTTKKNSAKQPAKKRAAGGNRQKSNKSTNAKRPTSNHSRRRLATARKLPLDINDGEVVVGRIQGNSNGYAFLIRDDKEKDVFIPPSSLNGAIHGDKVSCVVRQKPDGGADAIVLEVLEPTTRQFIGTFIRSMSGKAYVIADDKKLPYDIFIDENNSLEANNSDRVLVRVISRKKALAGKITRVFKDTDNIDWEIFSVILEHNIREEFDAEAIKESEKISETLSSEELVGRQDFRDTLAITIDGDDSRDFDDAVCLVKNAKGYELSVHIADVAHYVRAGSALDREAFLRGTSVYFPGSFVPMLPEKICNNVCSLMEDHDRLTLSVVMQINNKGKVTKHKITNGVIRSARRMTYTKVERILAGDAEMLKEYSDIAPMLGLMKELASVLNKRRTERGSVDFDLPESEIELSEDGSVRDVRRAPRLTSHRIIEEFMLITNETVAEHMNKETAPFVYRGHLPPNDLKLDSFSEFLAAVGVKWDRGEAVVPMDYSRLLASLPSNLTSIVNMMALRSMTKAAYFPSNKGHFGLASEFYCHFTAPIRRYPDLVIHRIIKDYLVNGKKCFQKYRDFVQEASSQSSFCERQADETERDVEDIYKARFMKDKIGEEYEGIISGVTDWGVYVELDNTIEGLVRKENLPNGDYSYNPILMSLSNISRIYKPGDAMKVKVLSITRNKIDFVPAD